MLTWMFRLGASFAATGGANSGEQYTAKASAKSLAHDDLINGAGGRIRRGGWMN